MEEIWQEAIRGIKKIHNRKMRLKPRENNFIGKLNEANVTIYDNIIDLHGYYMDQAYIILKDFILNAYMQQKKRVIVITGKGEKDPSLKVEVKRWLQYTEMQNYIAGFSYMPYNKGGEGALEVKIKRRYEK